MTDAQNEAKGLRKTAWASYIMNNQIDLISFFKFASLVITAFKFVDN
jgi:hypothetical protein